MLQYERAEIMHGPSAVSEAEETTETAFGDNLFYLINVPYKHVVFNELIIAGLAVCNLLPLCYLN